MKLNAVHHIQVTYPFEVEEAMLSFYSEVLGLTEIARPDVVKNDSGAWYKLGDIQLHVSREKNANNQASRRHFCFQVDNLNAFEEHLKEHGIEIIPDQRPLPECVRFFLRDPGGNRIEIAEFVKSTFAQRQTIDFVA
ncbi:MULTISPECIES: VOC family protein [unclassified Nostoc]|uniref:Bleomycin resistance protein n=1 Tax=Nostoc punctiforme NIES-2108 TaxID=1356359 RepID=A0A367S1Q6_NOSPU|nr:MULTISPECIES: VOC family protein [unclassified Nostoc]MBN3880004.1 VOC family protein [Nostoc sp. JL23]MBN3889642.1 VOC family protein [Nostoc sp. JL31]RCJ42807.1 bleomycin resistance protein [Nostoc punctiforme NIES-2108]